MPVLPGLLSRRSSAGSAGNADVALQWHHLPLAAHEPAASAEARLAECAGEAGGHAAFWQAVEWVYVHTRSDGQGLPEGLRYPDLDASHRTVHCERAARCGRFVPKLRKPRSSGVTATPSLRLHDRETGKAILLQGPIEGDALLSAMDMLAAGDPAATPTSGNACRRRRRHAQVASVFKATAQSAALTTTPFASHPGRERSPLPR